MKWIIVLLITSAALATAAAQAPAPSAPAGPSPEQRVMGYFVGDWSLEGTQKVSPTSPPAAFHGKEKSEWVEGQYFVETHTSLHGPLGDVRSTRVMEYNPADHAYTYNVYNSLGEHIEAVGHLDGGAWTWTAVQKLNGVDVQARYTFNFASKDSYTFKSEVASPGGGWVTVMDGKATRVQ